MAFCRHTVFAAFSEWRSCPCSAALSRSLPGGGHGGVSHSDGHSVVKNKKEAGTSKPAPAEFSFRRSKFDVPALYFTSAKKDVLYALFSWPTYMGV